MKKTVLISFLTIVGGVTAAKAATFSSPTMGIIEQPIWDKPVTFNSVVDKIEKKRSEIQTKHSTFEKNLNVQDKRLTDDRKKAFKEDVGGKRVALASRLQNIQYKFPTTDFKISIMDKQAIFLSQSARSPFKGRAHDMHHPE